MVPPSQAPLFDLSNSLVFLIYQWMFIFSLNFLPHVGYFFWAWDISPCLENRSISWSVYYSVSSCSLRSFSFRIQSWKDFARKSWVKAKILPLIPALVSPKNRCTALKRKSQVNSTVSSFPSIHPFFMGNYFFYSLKLKEQAAEYAKLIYSTRLGQKRPRETLNSNGVSNSDWDTIIFLNVDLFYYSNVAGVNEWSPWTPPSDCALTDLFSNRTLPESTWLWNSETSFTPMSWKECWTPTLKYSMYFLTETLSTTAPVTPWATLILSVCE